MRTGFMGLILGPICLISLLCSYRIRHNNAQKEGKVSADRPHAPGHQRDEALIVEFFSSCPIYKLTLMYKITQI